LLRFVWANYAASSVIVLQAFSHLFRGKYVGDASCGRGLLTALISRFGAREVISIDIKPDHIVDAMASMEYNRISNVRFVQGDIKDLQTRALLEDVDIVISEFANNGMYEAGSNVFHLLSSYVGHAAKNAKYYFVLGLMFKEGQESYLPAITENLESYGWKKKDGVALALQEPPYPSAFIAEKASSSGRRHRLLELSDPEVNLNRKIEELERRVVLSPEQESRVRKLMERYFKLERLVHRVKRRYISQGKLRLLNMREGDIFSREELQRQLRPYLHGDTQGTAAEGIDYISMFGEGAGSSDEFFDQDLISFTLEGFEDLSSQLGTGFENAGMAIVYSQKLENYLLEVAIDLPDQVYLGDMLLAFVTNRAAKDKILLPEILTLEGLRRLRTETILRRGTAPTFLNSTFRQDPFTPREVAIPDSVPSNFIEAIVVDDQILDQAMQLLPSLGNRVVPASIYFSNNSRVAELKGIREEILGIIADAPLPPKSSSTGKNSSRFDAAAVLRRKIRPISEISVEGNSLVHRINSGELNSDYIEELRFLEEVVVDAVNEVVLPARQEAFDRSRIFRKKKTDGPETWLTKHDTAAQARIVEPICERFPGIKFIVEEHQNFDKSLLDDGEAELVCIIDPIDGTGEFARATADIYADGDFQPLYYKQFIEFGTGVLICKRDAKTKLLQPLIGVGLLPELTMDESSFSLVEAVCDIDGTFINGKRVEALQIAGDDASNAIAIIEDRRRHSDYAHALSEKFGRTFQNVSSLVHFSMLAAGNLDNQDCAMVMLARPCIWDAAIGGFFAHKAGAKIRLFDKRDLFPLDTSLMDDEFRIPSVIATASALDRLVDPVIARVRGSLAHDPALAKSSSAGALTRRDELEALYFQIVKGEVELDRKTAKMLLRLRDSDGIRFTGCLDTTLQDGEYRIGVDATTVSIALNPRLREKLDAQLKQAISDAIFRQGQKSSSSGQATEIRGYREAWGNFIFSERICRELSLLDGNGKPDEDYIGAVTARTMDLQALREARISAVKYIRKMGLISEEVIVRELGNLLFAKEGLEDLLPIERRNIRLLARKMLNRFLVEEIDSAA